jgi:signal transduction histidine kinase
LEKLVLEPNQKVQKDYLVFDFDNDSFDEIIFTITEPQKLWLLYFDPSNNPRIQTKIFQLPIYNKKPHFVDSRLSIAQLDDDPFSEVIVRVGAYPTNTLVINGMWALDIEEKSVIWEKLSTERTVSNKPINIVDDSLSYIVYSVDASSYAKKRFIFSNGIYFLDNRDSSHSIFDRNLTEVKNAKIDIHSDDFTTDSLAYIRAVDSKNKLLWEREVGGISTKTLLDTTTINNQLKIVLATFSSKLNSDVKNSIEIINPKTGKVEKSKILKSKIRGCFVDKNNIYVTFKNKKIVTFDTNFNVIDSSYSDYTTLAFAKSHKLLLLNEGSAYIQSLTALDNNLNRVAKILSRGIYNFLPKSELISIYNIVKRKSLIYSIVEIPWYHRIPTKTLQGFSISVLVILLIITLLWINTLRQSTKKINTQKKEIEKTHAELKQTTSKLIRAEKLAVYGTIASGIAHEINSPLGAIINSAQRIKNDPNNNLEKNISLIEKAGKKSKAIIEKLLVSTRKISPSDNTNLIDTLNDWKELSGKQFDNLGIDLIVDVECNKKLAISSLELNQIITNLLFNARDAIMDSNKKVKKITFSSRLINNKCHIFVRDSGPGFNNNRLENPFEAFETTKEIGKGTGLGLWVVKNIVEKINGEIAIRNNDDGAEIEVIIPFFEETKV